MKEIITQKAENIRGVIRYLQKFKNALIVIYIDENIIESELFLSHIQDISLLHKAGLKVILVPGARKRIDEILSASNIVCQYKDDIRVTSEDAMPLIKMAAFDVSNIIMTSLAANKITAVIGNWVRSRAKGVFDGFDFGTAGEIDKLQIESINTVLNDGFIPIFPCIGWNEAGHPYNISSVSLAQQIAMNLNADKLFYLMESPNLNKDNFLVPDDFPLAQNGDIPAMDLEELDLFVSKNRSAKPDSNSSGKTNVLTLLEKAKVACLNGVSRVHILDGNIDGVLPSEIFSDLGSGTMIYKSNYGGIRPMEQTDIPSVLAIQKPFVEAQKLLPRTEQQLSAELSDFIVYEVDGGVHACAALHLYSDTGVGAGRGDSNVSGGCSECVCGWDQGEIAAVAVEQKFDHMGIGAKMIHFLIEKAKKQQLKSVFILTTQAADVFEKLGFKPDDISTLPQKRKEKWSPERNSKLFRLDLQ